MKTAAAGTHPEEFMQPQSSRAEHKADQQQPEELVTEELQKGLICGERK